MGNMQAQQSHIGVKENHDVHLRERACDDSKRLFCEICLLFTKENTEMR